MAATQNSWGDTGDLINFDDGTEAVVRPMSPTDSGALLRFHGHLSQAPSGCDISIHNDLSPSEVARFTQVDGEARVAFVVADAYQHRGTIGWYHTLHSRSFGGEPGDALGVS